MLSLVPLTDVSADRGREREGGRVAAVVSLGSMIVSMVVVSPVTEPLMDGGFPVDRGLTAPNFRGPAGARGRNWSGRLSSTGRAELGRPFKREAPATEGRMSVTLSGSSCIASTCKGTTQVRQHSNRVTRLVRSLPHPLRSSGWP
eukprot:4835627-Prymnesium_polylepis.3